MLSGLQAMGPAELAEIGKLIGGQDEKTGQNATLERILAWLGKTSGSSGKAPEAIERATLETVAKYWHIKFESTINTDELERSLRVKIASDASEYLGPSWKLACIFAAAGPVDAIPPKLKLLEKAASLAVPSGKARQQLMEEWKSNCKRWTNTEEALKEVKVHFATFERAELALNLSLVVALADGRLSVEEERLFKELYEQAGKTQHEAVDAIRRISSLFWDAKNKAMPKSAGDDARTDKIAAIKAAEMTLEGPGMLEGFVLEASEKLAGGDKSSAAPAAPKSGWQRVLGAFSGMSQFVSSQVSSQEQAILTRIVYLSILRQHGQFVADQKAAEKAAATAEARKETPSAPQIASEVGNESTAKAQRVVKLDPF